MAKLPLPEPPEYFPFRAGPFRQSMGMRVIDPRHWIELDPAAPAQLQLKDRLLREQRHLVFAAADSTRDASLELLELLIDHLCTHFADHFESDGESVLSRLTEQRLSRPDKGRFNSPFHPLEIAARLVQDDFCLMEPVGGQLLLTAGCVCFPSRWNILEKLGQSTAAIHGPVPLYEQHIGPQTDQFMAKLTPDRIVTRENWSLHDSPTLFRPDAPPMWPNGLAVEDVPTEVWLRVEHQSLRRLPRTGFIAFGIRTYVRPLVDLGTRQDIRKVLAQALDAWPEEVVRYKGCVNSIAAIRSWLSRG